MEKILKVCGMHCVKCKENLERVLLSLPGVSFAHARLQDGTVVVRLSGSREVLSRVKTVLQGFDYDAFDFLKEKGVVL